MKNYYIHEKKRTRSGKRAHVLVKKKLLRMVYHILKAREHWRWESEELTQKESSENWIQSKQGGAGIA